MKAAFKARTLAQARRGWKEIVIDRLSLGKVLPIVSGRISDHLLFGDPYLLPVKWAEYIEYPFEDRRDFTFMTQYTSVMLKADPDIRADNLYIKEVFLDFLKGELWERADEDLREELESDPKIAALSFSDFAERLEFPPFDLENKDALLTLAALPLPIFLTTSYSSFLEAALQRAGKAPRAEICYWNPSLHSIPSVFKDESYQPSVEEPLVYHLHGLDRYPASLVITQDDYLDFLVGITQDWDGLPLPVRQALTDSSLLLLGYELQGWDFRVVFRGLIKTSIDQRRPKSVAIQLNADKEQRDYLQNYLNQEAELEVYWGESKTLLQELYDGWAKRT